jgi:hypothetical protein
MRCNMNWQYTTLQIKNSIYIYIYIYVIVYKLNCECRDEPMELYDQPFES